MSMSACLLVNFRANFKTTNDQVFAFSNCFLVGSFAIIVDVCNNQVLVKNASK